MNEVQRFENLKKNIENDPTNFQARRELAMMCLDMGFDSMALKQLNFLSKAFPEDANLHFNMGICFEKLKLFKFALNSYKKAVELKGEPDFIYNLALAYENLEMDDDAMIEFKRVICAEPDDSNSFFCIGCLFEKRQEFEMAIKCFKKAVELNYGDYIAHFRLANMYSVTGQEDFAVEEYKKVIKLSSDYSWAYFNLGQIFYKRGDIENAIIMLNMTIEKNPKDNEAYKLLTQLYINVQDIETAKAVNDEMAENNAETGDYFFLKAKIAEIQGARPEYLRSLKFALDNESSLSFNKLAVLKELKEAPAEEVEAALADVVPPAPDESENAE